MRFKRALAMPPISADAARKEAVAEDISIEAQVLEIPSGGNAPIDTQPEHDVDAVVEAPPPVVEQKDAVEPAAAKIDEDANTVVDDAAAEDAAEDRRTDSAEDAPDAKKQRTH